MRASGALGVVLSVAVAISACGDDNPVSVTPCPANQHVVGGLCGACPAGTTNAAGDDPSGADTACDPVLCQLGEHVVAHACTACGPGTTNAAGDDASGADTTCDGTDCAANQHVAGHACVACPAGSTNAAGDDASGSDTACDPTLCPVDQRVSSHACVACGAGSTNAAGDDASGADTTCDPTLCPVDQRVANHACVACGPGSTNAAGDSAAGTDTTCDPTLCPVDQRVANHACVACTPGMTNAAGDDASGADTTCEPRLCAVDQRVQSNACVACPPGMTNAAGDDASGADTTCEPRLCAADQRVVGNACVACPPGTTNAPGDDASGANTTCDATLCAVDQRVVANACVACPAGSTNAAGDDASGANTTCDPTLCGADQRVAAHVCTACPPGSTNAAGDDASGANTTCDPTLCPANQHVVGNACTACPPGTTNGAGDDATGPNTSCDATLCAADQHVVGNACVACAPGTTNAAGDNASGANTTCDVILCAVNQRVASNACVACPAGESNASGDDASGGDTACEPFAILRLTEVAPNQTGGRDLLELQVLAPGTMRDLTVEQDGVTLATLPDVTVATTQLVVVHLTPAATVTTELAGQADCADTACYLTAWDVRGGITGITYTRRTIAVVDPYGDNQDVAAFSNLGTSPASYLTELAAVQASGDWLPATCNGVACTDATNPSANDVSADWSGCGTSPTSASVQRDSVADTDTEADWSVAPQTFGVANPPLCKANERVVGHACEPCPPGQSNLPGDAPIGLDTTCDIVAKMQLSEVAPNQSGSRDLVELLVLAAGTMRDVTVRQDGGTLATLPDVNVTAGQLVVVHLNPASETTELTSPTACTDGACYPGAWDVRGGASGIAYTRHAITVVDPLGDTQDAAAFTDNTTSATSYATALQAIQSAGDWSPALCGGSPCTDATTPSANGVSADWTGVGTSPASPSVQRRSLIDTDTRADWGVVPGTIGVFNPGPCLANEHVVSNGCVACPAGQSNLAGDNPSGPNTTCDVVAVLGLSEVAPNQGGGKDLVELQVLASGTMRDITVAQDGVAIATLPDVLVTAGQLVVVHFAPSGETTELATQADCTNAACYGTAWDVNGGAGGITFSRKVLAVVDPTGNPQDVAAFTNVTTSPAGYVALLQAVQATGDWGPATCGGNACTDATTPSANDVSASWVGAGTSPASASIQRRSLIDTDTKADWGVVAGSFGVANPGPCFANEHVVSQACVACPAGQGNLAGDNPAGADTACDLLAILMLTEVAPNQSSNRDLVELKVIAGGTMRGITVTQDGGAIATLPDLTVATGDVVVVHLTPAATLTTETTSQGDCTDAACYAGAWDVNGAVANITYSRKILAVVDPSGAYQDAVAFSNLTTSPAGYVALLQALQGAGEWLPATCNGAACTDATTPSTNDVSADWTGCGTTPAASSVRRGSATDTDTKADWSVGAPGFGAAP